MDDPDIDSFLRGASGDASSDVAVAWRCDLRYHDTDEEGIAYRQALLQLAPPQPDELVTLSVGKARALLFALRADGKARDRLGAGVLDEPDQEGAQADAKPSRAEDDPSVALRYLLIRGDEFLEGEPLRPGDVVILPSSIGGYRDAALDHASTACVHDCGPDILAATSRGGTATSPYWRLNQDALEAVIPSAARRKRILGRAAAAARGGGAAASGDRASRVRVGLRSRSVSSGSWPVGRGDCARSPAGHALGRHPAGI